jgi:hypothetical protein
VGPIAVSCGLSLIILGVGFYFGTGQHSETALIPAGFGVLLAVLGLLARRDHLRKHVMHAAAALGLVGSVVPLIQIGSALATDKEMSQAKTAEMWLMVLICGVFVGLCVRSFIVARRSRSQSEPK